MLLRWEAVPTLVAFKGADEVLTTVRHYFSSGNYCDVTPSMKLIGGGLAHLCVVDRWQFDPSEEDKTDLDATIAKVFGLPDFKSNRMPAARVDQAAAEFFENGVLPPTPKTN